jgi:transposase InsO family protein
LQLLFIYGPLLAAPPGRGELERELERETFCHPVTGEPITFGFSTLERWYYQARREERDPVGILRRRIRSDSGLSPSLSPAFKVALLEQYRAHLSWSYKLHVDNLVVRVEEEPGLGPMPSYTSVGRYMKAHGLFPRPRKRARATEGTRKAEERLFAREVRSFEAEYGNGLWHLDFHAGSRPVLTEAGAWVTPHCLAIIDDCSRLCCHMQWYLEETAEVLVHGLCQAFQKRALPRALMTDNGSAMIADETEQGLLDLSVLHELTLPYSPYQNGKQEVFWASVEGRLLSMLEGVRELTLPLLNEASQAWVELEYNKKLHSEIGSSPLDRYLDTPHVGRESPGSETLRRAFRSRVVRKQRRSDGTISLEARRFEIPGRYRHLERIWVRYARWDLSRIDLVDDKTGVLLAPIYPLDKKKNADGLRRRLPALLAEEKDLSPADPSAPEMAPLLRKLLAEYAATGLPPAYIPHLQPPRAPEDSHDQEDESL